MTANSWLHAAPLHLQALVWLTVLAPTLVGLGAAERLAGSRPGRFGRALLAAGPVLPVLVVLLIATYATLFVTTGSYGLQQWVTLGATPAAHPYDALLVGTAISSVVAMLALPVVSWLYSRQPAPPHPRPSYPLAPWLLGLLAICLALIPMLAWLALEQATPRPGLGWLALTPVATLLLAARAAGYDRAAPRSEHDVQGQDVRKGVPDVRAAWIRAGLLTSDAPPLVRLPSDDIPTQPLVRPHPHVERAWRACGQSGPAPGALDDLLDPHPHPVAWWVGDLPVHAEQAVICATLCHRLGSQGGHALVLTPDPEGDRARLATSLERLGIWSPGLLVTAADQPGALFATGHLPAAIFVDEQELDRLLLPLSQTTAARWMRSVSCLVLRQLDHGGPRAVTDRFWRIQRLHLALSGGPACDMVATGSDSRQGWRLLRRVSPGRAPQRAAMRPRAPGALVVWRATGDPDHAPWTDAAREALRGLGVPPSSIDPHGVASVGDLTGAGVVRAWRAGHHRLADPEVPVHHALWRMERDPLAWFLGTPGRLTALHDRGELPRPEPVWSEENPVLMAHHLQAARRDGSWDLALLANLFGNQAGASMGAEATGELVARMRDGRLERSRRLPIVDSPLPPLPAAPPPGAGPLQVTLGSPLVAHRAGAPVRWWHATVQEADRRWATEVVGLGVERGQDGHEHLAAMVQHLVTALLDVDEHDVRVVPLTLPGPEGERVLCLVDRHEGGMGIAKAVDVHLGASLLRLTRAVMVSCDCSDGCVRCTPAPVLAAGPDKQAAIRLLAFGTP